MEFLVFLAILFVIVSVLRRGIKAVNEAAKQAVTEAARQAQLHLPPDFFGTHALPADPVRQLTGAPGMISAPAMVSAARMGEESSSELAMDDTAGDHDLALAASEVVSLEPVVRGMDLAPRPIPVRGTIEAEVDWEAEHERFHKRFVDARAPSLAVAHGLLDDLRDRDSARRAVLMAEILGPPVSLRGPR